MKKLIIPIGLALVLAGAARADFNPVALTPGSYTFDIVVESNTVAAIPYFLTASQGGGTTLGDTTWFEQGYWRSPNQTIGVPHAGQVFTNQSDPNTTYIMPPNFATNNCLLADTTVPGGGTLTLNTPTTCTGLSIFGSSGGGNGTVNYTVTHADTTTETGTFTYNDWFNGANPAWTAGGRVPPGGGEQNNGANPRLYTAIISLTNTTSAVVSVSFSYNNGGHVGIYAISTTTDGTIYTPVVVGGFNETVIVPAAFPLTATMDQGTNTVDNGNLATWFEQGYYRANTNDGLPPSGSIFNSKSQPTHHYQMGNYSSNNAILIDANHLSANITPASLAPYTAFALLTAGGDIGGNNVMTNICIMQHQDGTSETNLFFGYDWFNSSLPGFVAWSGNGRVNMHDRTLNNLGNTFPQLFESYFVLNDPGSPVTNIVLRYGTSPAGNSTTYVMAVSATAGGIGPVILTEPQWVNAYAGSTAKFSVQLGAGTTPVYTWQKAPTANGPYTNMVDGGNVSGSTSSNLTLSSISANDQSWYQVVVTNAVGTATSTPPVELYLLTSTSPNITLPSDTISDSSFGNAIPSNAGQGVTNVIDRTTSKYLCFGLDTTNAGGAPFYGPVGFIITPAVGTTIVSAMRIYAADDHPERNPADIMLEGSNDGGSTWTTILADTALSLPDNRNAGGSPIVVTNQPLQEVDFANTTNYTTYRVTINNVQTNSTAIGMQVAEIELLGVETGPPVVTVPFTLAETNAEILGSTARLSVGIGGSSPFTLQWTKNGANLTDNGRITGSQSNVLTITNIQYSDAGYYQLNITNSQGHYSVYPGGGADQNLYVAAAATLFTNGAGWITSATATPASPIIADNVLALTTGTGNSARSAFIDDPLYIGAFEASFVYQNLSAGGADGFTFCLQNDPRGAGALGGGGGALGVSGITPSMEFTFNIYSGSAGGVGISFGTNGANGAPYSPTTNATQTVNLDGFDPIAISIVYNGAVAQVTLTDTSTLNTFSTNYAVGNLATLLGAQTAYVGFTGADGGIASSQQISDVVYAPLSTLSVHLSGANVVLNWPVQPEGYVLQSASVVTAPVWTNVGAAVTQVGGLNQVTIPLAPGSQFYRLVLPVPPQ